ncbi:hypothetical protein [Terriglobus albidus]|uniref:hypothetical protein n=1 Tax=Terriglobus albidus TaxID=1592106 RepID=UPI0021DFC3F5|nr:hypothetical protein [Terriglobus albidus]
MQFGVCVDQNTFRSQTLRAVRRDSGAVIKVPQLQWVERNNPAVVHTDCDVAASRNVFDCGQRRVGKIEFPS